jgi:hypothetical protein
MIDPDSEVITAAEVGAANTGDAAMASALPADLRSGDRHRDAAAPKHGAGGSGSGDYGQVSSAPVADGDAAYGTGALLAELDRQAITRDDQGSRPDPAGHFTKQQFRIDLDARRVTFPANLQLPVIPARHGGGVARFGRACQLCPLQASCTSSPTGRTITIHPQEARLQAARQRQRERPGGPTTAPTGPSWNASSPTCYAAGTADAAPACGAWCGSPRDWRLLAAAVT